MPIRARKRHRGVITTSAGALGGLWLAIDQYLDRHPETLGNVDELRLAEPDVSPPISAAEREALWWVLRRHLFKMSETAESDPLIDHTVRAIDDWLDELRFEADRRPHIGHVRRFVLALGDWIATLNAYAGLLAPQASALRQAVLQSSFPVLKLCLVGRTRLAARYLVDEWQTVAASLGIDLPGPEIAAAEIRTSLSDDRLFSTGRSHRRLLWTFQYAVFQLLRGEETQRESLEALIDLNTALDLDAGQLGQILDTTEEAVRKWETEDEPIPLEAAAALSEIQDSLQRLKKIFVPERLPQVIRRPAELFGGNSALDWILQGRIRQVADRYDLLLRYQS